MVKVSDLTLKEKVGQMIGLAFYGDEYSEELRRQVEEIGVGLIIYFKDNCRSLQNIYHLNKIINQKAKIPPFIALDQEGGMVARVTEGITQSPGAMAISAAHNPSYAYNLALNMGKELRSLGFNFNFAPDGDVNNNPLNPVINVRSYSENPDIVSDYMEQAVYGYTDAMLMTSVKHFPGHGDTSVDSHIGLPKVDYDMEHLNKVELVPFKRVVEKNLPGIMVSHVMYSKYDNYPATMSHVLVQELLRDKMGFNGLVVTDSLTMQAVWGRYSMEEIVYRTFTSGCDIMLVCGARDIKAQEEFASIALRLAESGKIPLEYIDRAVERILKYKEMFKCGEMPNSFVDAQKTFLNKKAVEFSQKVANESITIIKDNHKIIPIKKDDKTLIVFPIIKVVTLVENADNTLNSLGDFFPYEVDKTYISIDPTDAEKVSLLEKIKYYDKIVYCSYNACFNPNQAQLINSLPKDKLAVIAVRTPYDLNVLNVDTYLCSYEASVLAFKALVKVLTGSIKATGILPVTLK